MPATQFGNFKLRYQEILAEADAKNPVVPKSGRPGRTKQSHATNLILRLKEMGSGNGVRHDFFVDEKKPAQGGVTGGANAIRL